MPTSSKQFNTAYLLPGREWAVDVNGAQTLTCKYVVLLAAPLADAALVNTFTGLPAIGSVHPSFSGLYAQGYKIHEGEGSEKTRIIVDVDYAPISVTGEPQEGEEEGEEYYIEAIGWRSGSVSRDIVVDASTGAPVLNTAGQPFESVPQVDRPSPTFFKVFKSKTRLALNKYVNCVNLVTMTLGGEEFAGDMVRCVQADEERLFNDVAGFKYRYSVSFQVMSNKCKIAGGSTDTECGWQMPIVSMGTMELGTGTNPELKRITVRTDSGDEVPVSAPVLLDGNGHFSPTNTTPYVKLFVAYQRKSFLPIMYSEPEGNV